MLHPVYFQRYDILENQDYVTEQFNCITYIWNNLTEGSGVKSADLNKSGNK